MAKTQKKKSTKTSKATGEPGFVSRLVSKVNWLAVAMWIMLPVGLVVGGAALGQFMEAHVLQKQAARSCPYNVVIADQPDWMPDGLARQIGASFLPEQAVLFESPDICKRIYDQAIKSPWVESIEKVDRVRFENGKFGKIVVHAKFRRAVARVWDDLKKRFYFVDGQGYRLPNETVPKFRAWDGQRYLYFLEDEEYCIPRHLEGEAIYYVIVDGVRGAPPMVGEKWQANDLHEGLKLVKFVQAKPFGKQITCVNVSNHAKRISETEPELYMTAQVGRGKPTTIKFGRFPMPQGGDYVVSPERKMEYLQWYVREHGGQLAGVNDWLDLRMDRLGMSRN